jgi:hypothetical protein
MVWRWPGAIRAEVTRMEITSRQDVLGESLRHGGAYENLWAVYFTVDPNNAQQDHRQSGKALRNGQVKWNSRPTFHPSTEGCC